MERDVIGWEFDELLPHIEDDIRTGAFEMNNIAMILERPDLGTLYAQLAYVRILEEGRTEPIDASVGGDVASYLQRFHQAVLVDAPSFMEEWTRRRIQAKKEEV